MVGEALPEEEAGEEAEVMTAMELGASLLISAATEVAHASTPDGRELAQSGRTPCSKAASWEEANAGSVSISANQVVGAAVARRASMEAGISIVAVGVAAESWGLGAAATAVAKRMLARVLYCIMDDVW